MICYNLPGTEKSTTSGTAKPAETKPVETTAPAETPAPAETQAPAPAETQAPGPAPTTAPTQAETKAPETAAPTQAGPGGPFRGIMVEILQWDQEHREETGIKIEKNLHKMIYTENILCYTKYV